MEESISWSNNINQYNPSSHSRNEFPTYLPFHMKSFWEKYYKQINMNNLNDWYFELNNLKSKRFDIKSFDQNSEIFIIGVGNSKILDYFLEKKFAHLSVIDFSNSLIEWIKKKYETKPECEEWDCINI